VLYLPTPREKSIGNMGLEGFSGELRDYTHRHPNF
jgi:hypothetical protein